MRGNIACPESINCEGRGPMSMSMSMHIRITCVRTCIYLDYPIIEPCKSKMHFSSLSSSLTQLSSSFSTQAGRLKIIIKPNIVLSLQEETFRFKSKRSSSQEPSMGLFHFLQVEGEECWEQDRIFTLLQLANNDGTSQVYIHQWQPLLHKLCSRILPKHPASVKVRVSDECPPLPSNDQHSNTTGTKHYHFPHCQIILHIIKDL
ncbi:hypothetical protein SAY87_031353 [Trapa incisa]|uniref:Uncharacterized protein n=1 Tax=Trapa incisa TaxID=236973 RepID=A0AAN7QLH0_9MYRT|nr:hypothetical protein SAY87_031353 [Trapa incisa]